MSPQAGSIAQWLASWAGFDSQRSPKNFREKKLSMLLSLMNGAA